MANNETSVFSDGLAMGWISVSINVRDENRPQRFANVDRNDEIANLKCMLRYVELSKGRKPGV